MMLRLASIGLLALQATGPFEACAEDSRRDSVEVAPVAQMTEWDHRNLEQNLRWMLLRERRAAVIQTRVAVFADAGVWHVGPRSIVESLEREGIGCRIVDRSQLKAEVLNTHETLILPGGWAPFQWAAAGQGGLAAIRSYVEQGGRCMGVCAGAYLLSRETRSRAFLRLCIRQECFTETMDYPRESLDGTQRDKIMRRSAAIWPLLGLSMRKPAEGAGAKRCLQVQWGLVNRVRS